MVAYLRQLVDELIRLLDEPFSNPPLQGRVAVLVEELDRLDPLDFVPAARLQFVNARRVMRDWARLPDRFWECFAHFKNDDKPISGGQESLFAVTATLDNPEKVLERLRHQPSSFQRAYWEVRREFVRILREVGEVLSGYGGKNCRLVARDFAFVTNPAIRKIVGRDYRELSMVLFPGGAWKSTVVLAGGILEAILYDQLTKDAVMVGRAMTATDAPKKKGGVRNIQNDKPEDDWKLSALIDVSVELGVITADRGNTVDQVLREFRNFVHARAELKMGEEITEAEAGLAKHALDGVCNQLK